MAKLIRPSWAIRCTQSGCKTLFEVAKLENGKQHDIAGQGNVAFLKWSSLNL